MADSTTNHDETMSEEISQNPGMKAAMLHVDPTISLEEARNANEGEAPNGAGSVASSTAEESVRSTSDPNPSDIPSTDHPLPDDSDNDQTAGASSSFSKESGDRYAH